MAEFLEFDLIGGGVYFPKSYPEREPIIMPDGTEYRFFENAKTIGSSKDDARSSNMAGLYGLLIETGAMSSPEVSAIESRGRVLEDYTALFYDSRIPRQAISDLISTVKTANPQLFHISTATLFADKEDLADILSTSIEQTDFGSQLGKLIDK